MHGMRRKRNEETGVCGDWRQGQARDAILGKDRNSE